MLHFSSINRSCPAFSTFPAVITHSFSLQCHNDSAVARIYGCNASRIRDHYLTEVCPFTHDLFHVLSTFRVITVCDHQTFACGIAALFARNLRHPVERPGHAARLIEL